MVFKKLKTIVRNQGNLMANREKLFVEKFKRKPKCAKDRFASEFDVNKRAKILGMRGYYCSFCRGWHLTSKVWRKS